jgi:hypothetical protein
MLDTSQKLPLARSLNRLAIGRAHDAIQQTGKNLPASIVSVSGSIVTVKFEIQGTTLANVTCPVIGSEFIRLPLKAGVKGMVISSDLYLGGVTGLGGGVASMNALPANLSAVAFVPLGNKGFDAPEDVNKIVLYGPDGAVLRTADKSVEVTVDKTVGVTIKAGTFTWTFGLDGTMKVPGAMWMTGNIQGPAGGTYGGSFQTSGDITAGFGTGDQVRLQTHNHISAASGSPTSGPVAGT